MNIIDRITIDQFHNNRIEDFGSGSVESLGWYDTESQTTRFEILSGIAKLDGLEVMDVGCGHGDLLPLLYKKYPGIKYIGVEQNASFLNVALDKYGAYEHIKFLLGDFINATLPAADFILCSGALSYHNHDTNFIQYAIKKLFSTCRRGLAFNLLSKVKNPGGILVAYDPENILHICQQLTPHVELHQNYLPEDFTIFLYHDEQEIL